MPIIKGLNDLYYYPSYLDLACDHIFSATDGMIASRNHTEFRDLNGSTFILTETWFPVYDSNGNYELSIQGMSDMRKYNINLASMPKYMIKHLFALAEVK